MASLDFIYDLSDKLTKDNFNYVLFVLDKPKNNKTKKRNTSYKSKVFYRIDSKKSARIIQMSLESFRDCLKENTQ